MDLIIRNINANTAAKIDSMAKENKVSRNIFLGDKVEEIAFSNEKNELENRYQMLIDNLVKVTKEHTKVLGSFMDEFIIDSENAFNLNVDYTHLLNKISSNKNNFDYLSKEKHEIKVKSLPLDVLKRIDEIANERGISRNEFLNIYLRQLTYSNTLKLVDEKYSYIIEKTLGILDFSNRVTQLFYDENCIDISNFNEGDSI